ncbi:unnamed protein product [Notodromas monacha]|uniref:F5/8 type C domain-containing protein n=1 Tax=Notodromas monacha TaxID=399045 RepID=A0A7R9BF26_9CRUS|nr:unnamed protein product [Notodromas monacha]CAG0913317.1 unnamed protein product [Notodromas monacha]
MRAVPFNIGHDHQLSSSRQIRQEIHAGAWCPRSSISDSVVEWLEIDLRSTFVIIGMETQGRHGMGLGKEYAEFYRIMYMRPGFNEWRPYRDRKDNQVFEGNKDTRDSKFNRLDPPIIADKVRFIPFSKHVRTVCMRVELHGCNHTEDLVSYSARQGDALSSGIMMHDWIYDGGISADGWLHNGIGTLYDGRLGLEDFKHDSHSWVGWKRSSASLLPGTTEPFLRFSFHFQTPGNLSAILIHMNNKFSDGIQVCVPALFSRPVACPAVYRNSLLPNPATSMCVCASASATLLH